MPNTFPMHHFDKYDFVKSFVAIAKTADQKEEKEKEALVIAKVIEQYQENLAENTATKLDIELVRKDIELLRSETKKDIESLREETKQDIALVRKDLVLLEHKLTIKLTAIIAALMTFLPLATQLLQKFFN